MLIDDINETMLMIRSKKLVTQRKIMKDSTIYSKKYLFKLITVACIQILADFTFTIIDMAFATAAVLRSLAEKFWVSIHGN
mgnify:CR=1 FL=1